jgi:hypothetical protein
MRLTGKSELLGENLSIGTVYITDLTGTAPRSNLGICCERLLIVFKNQVCISQRTLATKQASKLMQYREMLLHVNVQNCSENINILCIATVHSL